MWTQLEGNLIIDVMCHIQLMHAINQQHICTPKMNQFNQRTCSGQRPWPSFTFRGYCWHFYPKLLTNIHSHGDGGVNHTGQVSWSGAVFRVSSSRDSARRSQWWNQQHYGYQFSRSTSWATVTLIILNRRVLRALKWTDSWKASNSLQFDFLSLPTGGSSLLKEVHTGNR